MSFQKETKKYFLQDSSAVAEYLGQNSQIWDQSNERQKAVPVFKQTRSVAILYDFDNPFSYFQKFHSDHEKILDLLAPTLGRIERNLSHKGYWFRILLADMPAGSEIATHVDMGWNLSFSYRFHWVISTNPQVEFVVDDKKYHFEKNEIWQINNRSAHSVVNRGETGRIHMVADFAPAHGCDFQLPVEFEKNSKEYHYFELLKRVGPRLKRQYF